MTARIHSQSGIATRPVAVGYPAKVSSMALCGLGCSGILRLQFAVRQRRGRGFISKPAIGRDQGSCCETPPPEPGFNGCFLPLAGSQITTHSLIQKIVRLQNGSWACKLGMLQATLHRRRGMAAKRWGGMVRVSSVQAVWVSSDQVRAGSRSRSRPCTRTAAGASVWLTNTTCPSKR
jgi:hypothetical protein